MRFCLFLVAAVLLHIATPFSISHAAESGELPLPRTRSEVEELERQAANDSDADAQWQLAAQW